MAQPPLPLLLVQSLPSPSPPRPRPLYHSQQSKVALCAPKFILLYHKPTIHDAHITEQLERKQRLERERCAKHKHVEQLSVICSHWHGRKVIAVNRVAQDKDLRLGPSRAVLNFHTHTEKEEHKHIERLAKECLKALKADDEEAYMKLIDTAKDTHITHLL